MSDTVCACSVTIQQNGKNLQGTFELHKDYYHSFDDNSTFEKMYFADKKVQFKVGSKKVSFMKLFSKSRSYFQIITDSNEGIEYFAEKEDIDKLDNYFRMIEKKEQKYKDQVPDQFCDDELQNSMQRQQIFPNQIKQSQKVLDLQSIY